MNAEYLKTIIKRVAAIDKNNTVQSALNRIESAMAAAQQNNTKQTQNAIVSVGREAVEAARRVYGALSPEQKRDIAILKVERYFSEWFPSEIEHALHRLQTAPNVGREELRRLIEERNRVVHALTQTSEGLSIFGIEDEVSGPGDSEIEVVMPRSLFDNDLQAFQRELDALAKIIRTFYEINNVTPESIQLKHISASEPIITVAVVVGVALAIGNAVKLCIDILNGAYSLRNAMRDARSSRMADENIIVQIENQIHKSIEVRIDEGVQAAMQRYAGEEARRNELEMHTRRAITLLLERIDRGMKVIPRVVPPSEESAEMTEQVKAEYREAASIASSLEFPKIEGEPILKLSHHNSDGSISSS